ncbi:MAG: ComF family protein [Pseudomonadota bacterium]
MSGITSPTWRITRPRPSPASRWALPLGRLLFPPTCPITRQPVLQPGALSPEGWQQLQFVTPPNCTLCGVPFEHEVGVPICASCAAPKGYDRQLCGPGLLDRVRSALTYDQLSAELILQLKYGDRHDLAPILGGLMLPSLAALEPPSNAVLHPVPLHAKRLRTRRFNQAALLAQALSERSGMPLRLDLLRRIKSTPQQRGLGFAGRRRNLSGAFAADPQAKGQAVVLVDDVLTSGATLISAAKALRKAGVSFVGAVTVARVFETAKDPQVLLPEV